VLREIMAEKKSVILVVDDQPVQLKLLFPVLEKAGYEVVLAETGAQAVAIIESRPVDLILLDILMPGIDGLETCRQIKENKDMAEIPIIFMTALVNLEDKIIGFEAGCVDYITKPFQHVEVLARVNTHIKLGRQRRALETALAEVKQLTGILPICCKCKKIRDDKGYWSQVDQYLSHHADVQFTHAYCQDCYDDEMAHLKEMKAERNGTG
jgi:DNA-binding response OmpR family regulator